jgi:hypothetical protein
MIHQHRRDPRLSTPSVDLCACGAISIWYPAEPDREEWLETSWEPGPVPLPQRSERPTTPLPLVLVQSLELGGWCVRS